jgi:hypothetical protein
MQWTERSKEESIGMEGEYATEWGRIRIATWRSSFPAGEHFTLLYYEHTLRKQRAATWEQRKA